MHMQSFQTSAGLSGTARATGSSSCRVCTSSTPSLSCPGPLFPSLGCFQVQLGLWLVEHGSDLSHEVRAHFALGSGCSHRSRILALQLAAHDFPGLLWLVSHS
eukprot:3849029-Rhodomonas_salina.1